MGVQGLRGWDFGVEGFRVKCCGLHSAMYVPPQFGYDSTSEKPGIQSRSDNGERFCVSEHTATPMSGC